MQSNVQAAAPSSEVPSQSQVDFAMDPSPPERGTKRSAEDDPPSESHKKAKIGIITFACSRGAQKSTNSTSRTERSSS